MYKYLKEEIAVKSVGEILVRTIKHELRNIGKIAIPFSGSLDSSLIAFLVKEYTNTKPLLYTIGFPDCYDFKQSFISGKLLNLKPKHILIKDGKLESNLEEYKKLTNDKNKVSISYSLPFYILLNKMPEGHVITGHGADTLFGGFHKYLKSQSLKSKIKENYQSFINNLDNREYKIAKHFNKSLILPFADKKLANYVLSLPKDLLIRNNTRKYLLRKVAESLGLADEICKLPKKAFQYSSGMMKKLRKLW